MYGAHSVLNSGLNTQITQDADSITVRSLSDELLINQGLLTGYFMENKFGFNQDVDAAEDIWDGGGDYTGFPTSTLETVSVVSSSVNDTSAGTGARTIRIFGLDTNYSPQQEDITLNGTTPATSVNTYRRIYRAYILTAGSGTTNAGALTIRHTTTTANVFSVITAGYGQSNITSYTIPSGYTGYMVAYRASMLDSTSNQATIAIWTREYNTSAIRLRRQFAVSTTTSIDRRIFGGIKFTEKTDLVFRCTSVQNTNGNINLSWDMVLVKNS